MENWEPRRMLGPTEVTLTSTRERARGAGPTSPFRPTGM